MLFSLQRMPDWSDAHPDGEAKCRRFQLPLRGDDPWFDDRVEAKEICNGTNDDTICPRRAECLHMAMVNFESYGIWGGMTEDERRALRMKYPGQPYRWSHESLEDSP
jgi:Transcription factor WhiB